MSGTLKDYWGAGSRPVRGPQPTASSSSPSPSSPVKEEHHSRFDKSVIVVLLFVAWLPWTRSPEYFARIPLLLLVAAALGIVVLRMRRAAVVSLRVWGWVAILVAAALASVFLSDRPEYALFGDGNGFPAVVIFGSLLLIPFARALAAATSQLKTMLIIAGAVALGLDLASSWSDIAWLPEPMLGEAEGILLLALLPLVWGGILAGNEKRALLRIAGTLIVFAALLRIGRQDFLAFFAVELLALTTLAARRLPHWLARGNVFRFSMVMIALAVLFAFKSFPRVAELSLTHGTTWSLVTQGVRERPAFGFGPGAFDEVYTRFRPSAQTSESFWTIVPREGSSFALTLAATYGTVFTFVLYAGVLGVMWQSFRRKGRQNDVTFAIVVLVVLSFATSFSREGLLLLCLALAMSLDAPFSPFSGAVFRGRASVALASLGILAALYGGMMMTRYAVADALFVQAYENIRETSRPEIVQSDLQRVRSWYAWDAEYALTAAQHAAVMISLDTSKGDELAQAAVRDVQQAVALNPNSKTMSDALLVLRDLETASGKNLSDETEAVLEALAKRDERNPLTHLFIGEHYVEKAKLARESQDVRTESANKARKAFARVEELSPNTIAAKLGNVQLALLENRHAEAETMVQELIAAFPNELQFSVLLAKVYEEQERAAQSDEERNSIREKEKTVLTTILERDPMNVEAKNRLAELGQ